MFVIKTDSKWHTDSKIGLAFIDAISFYKIPYIKYRFKLLLGKDKL